MSKILLINGSPNRDGTTAAALKIVEAAIKEKSIETHWFQLSTGPVRGCIGCERCESAHRCVFTDDQANELIEKIAECDGVVIGSPVYFAGPNGALLALLDRVFYAGSCHGRLFKGKPGAAVVSLWRAGSTASLDRLHKYFSYSEMPIVSSTYWNMLHNGDDRFGEKTLHTLGENMADLVLKTAAKEVLTMKELLKKPLPVIPADIAEKLTHPEITLTAFENKNDILCDGVLQHEIGYRQFPDGSWLVSMTCPMPGITAEMIRWWFWWHPQEALRYQVWFPGSHFGIRYNRKDKAYFEQAAMPPFQPNSQYPVEEIGGSRMPLRIDFVMPEQFGFSREAMERRDVAEIVCGHVSAFNGLVKHTEMAHIFKETEEGLFMISRFWLGKTMHPLLRKIVMTDKMARGMAEHCCIEYRNLCQILPSLYKENAL